MTKSAALSRAWSRFRRSKGTRCRRRRVPCAKAGESTFADAVFSFAVYTVGQPACFAGWRFSVRV